MRRRPRTNVDPERSERLRSIEIARAQLFDLDSARKRPIDRVIDYFGAGSRGLARDPCGESLLDVTGVLAHDDLGHVAKTPIAGGLTARARIAAARSTPPAVRTSTFTRGAVTKGQ